jgi:hypothetical protein
VPDELTSTAGIVALVAAGIGLVAMVLAGVLALRFRRLQAAQRFIIGDVGERDLVGHSQSLQQSFDELHARVQNTFQQLDQRLANSEQRLNRSVSHAAVVRYDAYNEMSGRQSSSIALLDDTGTGVVMSSILHREQARVYVKGMRDGKSEFELSPEENEAVRNALGSRESR